MVIQHLVCVDVNVQDAAKLLTDVPPHSRIVSIDADSPGVDQVWTACAGLSQLRSIHIVSHGAPGQIQMGHQVKVCAVSEVWSSLKLVVRRELRLRTPT